MQEILIKKLEYIYKNCLDLVVTIIGENFDVAGNIAIFSQSEEEYLEISKLAKELTKHSDNPNQKYFELTKPITLENKLSNSKSLFTNLYVRKYDDSEYGKNLGDIDFVVDSKKYDELKSKVMQSKFPGASMYNRPGWDTIQLVKDSVDVVAYVSTQAMAEKARIKFDSATML